MESGGDVKQNGWVSVLNSPSGSGYNTPRRTMSPAGSGCNTPRRTKSPSGSVHTLVAPVSPVSPGGSLTGKRSFRPGGIYEVASQEGLSVPGKGEDGERRGARLM